MNEYNNIKQEIKNEIGISFIFIFVSITLFINLYCIVAESGSKAMVYLPNIIYWNFIIYVAIITSLSIVLFGLGVRGLFFNIDEDNKNDK